MKRAVVLLAVLTVGRIALGQESCIPYVVEPCTGDPALYECAKVTTKLSSLQGGESASLLQELCFRVGSPLFGDILIEVDGGTMNIADLEPGDAIGALRFDALLSAFGEDCPVGDQAKLTAPIRVGPDGDDEQVMVTAVIEEVSDPMITCLLRYDPTDEAHNDGRMLEGTLSGSSDRGFELRLQLAALGANAIHPGLETGDLRATASPAPVFFDAITLDGLFVLPKKGGPLSVFTTLTAENEFYQEVQAAFEETFDIQAASGETTFVRGNANGDDKLDLSDAVFVLGYLFLGGGPIECLKSADADDNGSLELTDAVRILNFLFLGGPEPASPFPDCGLDGTPDELTCESFGPCE